MFVNGEKIIGTSFAYDGCHKIYICEDPEDRKMMVEYGYELYPLKDLKDAYESSCSLRFIENAKLTKTYVAQFEEAVFDD